MAIPKNGKNIPNLFFRKLQRNSFIAAAPTIRQYTKGNIVK
jgi:hypothetical protein